MYKATVKVHVRCPKHRLYNPEKQGEGAIKGGCTECNTVLQIQRRVLEIRQLVKHLEEQRV